PKEAHGSDHGWKAMKNSKRLRIFAVLLPASFPGCGGDGGSDYDCPVFPPAASFPYILPWQIGESRVANPHIARGDSGTQRYAIDVPMPIGTQVFAIRSGVNLVLVRHDDGTVARYAHLTVMGAIVQLGDGVAQGQLIALSGNTALTLRRIAVHAILTACRSVRVFRSISVTPKRVPMMASRI
ncbi:MAG: M23 family metallopeptidase, partial [Rhodoplanes sp.]